MSGEVNTVGWGKKSLDLLSKAAGGHVESQYSLGLNFLKGEGVPENHKLAVEWLEKSAARGFEDAQYLLGHCYENGIGVERSLPKALTLYGQAASAANKHAQFALGEYHAFTNNFDLATEWFKKSARQNYPPAQFELGKSYFYGLAKIKDEQMGREFIQKAADKNYAPAIELLPKL